MKLLEERIRRDGVVKEGNILKVDSFLNHQMDVELFNEMGKEFCRLFSDRPVNKILTIGFCCDNDREIVCTDPEAEHTITEHCLFEALIFS